MNFSQSIKDTLIFNPIQINPSLIIEVFNYQFENCLFYNEYCKQLKCKPSTVTTIDQIPFLPISFFKNFQIVTPPIDSNKGYTLFESSGTTGVERSKHLVYDSDWYVQRSIQLFEHAYGKLEEWNIIPIVASYKDNPHSSLLYMLNEFIKKSKYKNTHFFNSYKEIPLELYKQPGKKMFWGVTYALLDWAEQAPIKLDKDSIVLETGGMKGKRAEMHRKEVHELLMNAFEVNAIHSEYGMTELLSQSYSKGDGVFDLPSGIIPMVREINDPLTVSNSGRGGLNVIDLANIDSCCFIETQDYVQLSKNSFEVLGRLSGSESRGCNLMYEG
jgi:phenylacetate-coenzyme A ligase PaaK-like adenylate-forming protein